MCSGSFLRSSKRSSGGLHVAIFSVWSKKKYRPSSVCTRSQFEFGIGLLQTSIRFKDPLKYYEETALSAIFG